MRALVAVALTLITGCATPTATEPSEAITEKTPMLELRTTGGFTGLGLGELKISGSTATASFRGKSCTRELTTAERQNLDKTIGNALTIAWRESYVREDNPYGAADQIRYELAWREETTAITRATWWYDETTNELPTELRRLVDLLTEIRTDLLSRCA
jgi:hypothetical protein